MSAQESAQSAEAEYVDCTCGHDRDGHDANGCFPACGCTRPGPAPTPLAEFAEIENDERHWRTAMISQRERAEWIAVDEALRPFLNCEPTDHHPSCCPAVIAVMKALGLHKNGVFRGTPEELFGPVPPEIQAEYEQTIRRIEESERSAEAAAGLRLPPGQTGGTA